MGGTPGLSTEDIHRRLLRFNDMIPCKTAFIDARTPGSDQKENFCLIGAGVAENPDQVVHIPISHGFDIGAAKQPPGCKNSHHSHNTEEVFVIHNGEWQFTWGHDGSGGSVVLTRGDTISIPTHMFRGFENVGTDDGLMFSVLGLNPDGSAGHVIWAPYVIEQAKSWGLVLLDDGQLLDTTRGDIVPPDAKEETPLSMEEVAKYQVLSSAEMSNCVLPANELAAATAGGLSHIEGVQELAVIGIANPQENIGAGKLNWAHGFQVRRLQLQSGAVIAEHIRAEEEVLIVHAGSLTVKTPQTEFTLNAGDLFTTPIGSARKFSNVGDDIADVIVVRRGDQPEAAKFI
ncbi:MAG: cupin domain-containing protein [Pseudomonadota bacterium]